MLLLKARTEYSYHRLQVKLNNAYLTVNTSLFGADLKSQVSKYILPVIRYIRIKINYHSIVWMECQATCMYSITNKYHL